MACSIWASIRFFKHGLRRRNLFERKLAIFLVQLLEAIETVARVAHHFASLGTLPSMSAFMEACKGQMSASMRIKLSTVTGIKTGIAFVWAAILVPRSLGGLIQSLISGSTHALFE